MGALPERVHARGILEVAEQEEVQYWNKETDVYPNDASFQELTSAIREMGPYDRNRTVDVDSEEFRETLRLVKEARQSYVTRYRDPEDCPVLWLRLNQGEDPPLFERSVVETRTN